MKRYVRTLVLTLALAALIPLPALAAVHPAPSVSGEPPAAAPSEREHRVYFRGPSLISQEVLNLLKLDRDTLRRKLEDGRTLAQIAREQGVSREALKQALTASFHARIEEKKKRFAANLDRMIDSKIVPGRKLERSVFGHMLNWPEAAAALGLTEEQLKQGFAAGKSLSDMARERGVDVGKLKQAQHDAIARRLGAQVQAGAISQAEADERLSEADRWIERMINAKGAHPPS